MDAERKGWRGKDPLKVHVAGPAYSPEERAGLEGIADLLEAEGFSPYLPHRQGIEALCRPGSAPSGVLRQHAFALEIFQVTRRCEALVLSLNGRVPDEGALFKAALAFALGKPLVIYKRDRRSAFHGSDNSMITGMVPPCGFVRSCRGVPGALKRALGRMHGRLEDLPPAVQRCVTLGEAVWGVLAQRELAPAEVCRHIEELCHEEIQPRSAEHLLRREKVYCSGALFCPEEVRAMAELAQVLETNGYATYLPQRDGVEAWVMGAVDNPLANAWIFTPIRALVHRAVFALDIYQIVCACDAFVCNLNGRVPDEGAVIETAVAFAAGRPVVIYKQDGRVLDSGGDSYMLLGAEQARVDDPALLPQALSHLADETHAPGLALRRIARLGCLIEYFLKPLRWGRGRIWR